MINLSLHHYPYIMDSAAADSTSAATSSPFSAPQRPNVMEQPVQTSSSPAASGNTSFAFLVHSQDTIPNNLPPDVDNKPLARQRRRRTRYAVFILPSSLERVRLYYEQHVHSYHITSTLTKVRCSPEDQIILEEEFLKDSKPDKAARTRIVERVALGEKEVQVYIPNDKRNER